jgi:ABC-type transport system involved in multi-copper enzyme maturation permease subunit
MTFLPIVDRELRVAARRHSTHWSRLVLALAAIVVGFFLFLAHARTSSQLLAKEIFGGFGGLALLYCLASGRRSTADCLSEEKREGTLGLLFLTDLKGYDVVLGKLAATSVNAFYGLLAIVPVLAIPLLMGGVTNGEFWRTVLVLVDTFLFSLAIGVFASVLSRDARQAMGTNLLLLLALAGLPPAAAGTIAYLHPAHRIVHELLFPCPAYAFYFCFDASYISSPKSFWISVAVIHGLTWGLVLLSSWMLPHLWQDQRSGKSEARWLDRWRAWVYGRPEQRRALRRKLLELNPFCWLASRARFKSIGVWLFLGFVGCWWFYLRLAVRMNWFEETFSLTTALMLNSVLKAWVAIEAGQRLAEEQKMGTLELLLSTPLNERDILRGQFLALKRQFLKPLLVVIAIEVIFMLALFRYSLLSYEEDTKQVVVGCAGIVLLVLDLVALIGVAQASALTARSPNYASVSTISRVLILPWVLGLAISAIANLWASGGPGLSWKFFLHLWFWLGIAADLAFGLPAWWQLKTRFRELALQRITTLHVKPAPGSTA